jgi:hypothetical protein
MTGGIKRFGRSGRDEQVYAAQEEKDCSYIAFNR